jgi:type IV secretion system protein VirB1
MILPLASVIAMAAACAPGVAPETMAAIVQTESRGDVLAVHDNTERQSYHPADKAEAIALARQLIGAGHSVDLGIMQVNVGNLGWARLSIEDAFEPCTNLTAGAMILKSYSVFNTGNPRAGFTNGYVRRVLTATAEQNSPRGQPDAPPAPGNQPPTPATASGAKSPDWNVFPDDQASQQSSNPSGDYHAQD